MAPAQRRHRVGLSAIALAAVALFTVLFAHTLGTDANGNLNAGFQTVWADWSQHLTTASSFAVAHNLPPQNPLFSGQDLRYPFLPDFQSATLVTLGATPAVALALPGALLAVCVTLLVVALAVRLGAGLAVGALAAAICMIGGGLGFTGILADACVHHGFSAAQCTWSGLAAHPGDLPAIIAGTLHDLPGLVAAQPRAYDGLLTSAASQPMPNQQWYTPLFAWWLPQRSILYGFSGALVALILLLAAVRSRRARLRELRAGRPVARPDAADPHPHADRHGDRRRGARHPVAPPRLAGHACGHLRRRRPAPGHPGRRPARLGGRRQPVPDRRTGMDVPPRRADDRRCRRCRWSAASAASFVPWCRRSTGCSGWRTPARRCRSARWLRSRWRHAACPGASALSRPRVRALFPPDLVRVAMAFTAVFVVANLVVFQSWDWDNTKLLAYWYLGAALLLSTLVVRWWRRWWRGAAAAVMAITVLLTGVLVLARLLPWTPAGRRRRRSVLDRHARRRAAGGDGGRGRHRRTRCSSPRASPTTRCSPWPGAPR